MGPWWTKKPNPIRSTYTWVLSRKSARITFTYAVLNGIEVCAEEIKNAFLHTPSYQKYYNFLAQSLGSKKWASTPYSSKLYMEAGLPERFPEPSLLLYEAFGFCIMPRRSRHIDAASQKFECHRLLWVYYTIYRQHTSHKWECWAGAMQGTRPVTWTHGKIHWTPQNISRRIYKIGQTRNGVRDWDSGSSQYVNLAVKNVEAYVSKQSEDWWKLPAKIETPLKHHNVQILTSTLSSNLLKQHTSSPSLESYVGLLSWEE